MTEKRCTGCGDVKSLDDFPLAYRKSNPEAKGSRCRKCYRKKPSRVQSRKRRIALKASTNKARAIAFMGGKCQSPTCPLPPDLVLPPRCFDFHHIDRGTKVAIINHLVKQSWAATARELVKCQMLCCLCHRMLHAELDGQAEDGSLVEPDVPIAV